jgi:membrane protease subunit (stomatin/prohibitin family)
MSILKHKKSVTMMDQIRCDERSYLIWKWHPKGAPEGWTNRENAIRWGSSLRVKEGEAAVFLYTSPDGAGEDFVEGPFDDILKTKNLPVLASIIGLAYNGGTPFQAEVYFINLAQVIQIKFGVPFFDVFEPRYPDFAIPVAVRGTMSFRISHYREFIKLNRLRTFSIAEFQAQVRDTIAQYVKSTVLKVPSETNIPVIQIETQLPLIHDTAAPLVQGRLLEKFGVTVIGFDISAVEIDKESEGYMRLMGITRDVTAATIEAQKEVAVKNIHDKQRVDIENYAENLRIQREEGQYAVHKQTQTSNFASYQTEAQTAVGIAGAEALGKMGENGGGSVNLGRDSGFSPASMMAGMAVGGAVGNKIADAMNKAVTPQNGLAAMVPPPVPSSMYHVVVDGQAVGPYDMNTLKVMALDGRLTADMLVWKPGMTQWVAAGSVEELKSVVTTAAPPIPHA